MNYSQFFFLLATLNFCTVGIIPKNRVLDSMIHFIAGVILLILGIYYSDVYAGFICGFTN